MRDLQKLYNYNWLIDLLQLIDYYWFTTTDCDLLQLIYYYWFTTTDCDLLQLIVIYYNWFTTTYLL